MILFVKIRRNENMDRGEYWGNRKQFMKMQNTVFDKLTDCKKEEG